MTQANSTEYFSSSSSSSSRSSVNDVETGIAVPGHHSARKSNTSRDGTLACSDDDRRRKGRRSWIIAGITAAIVIILIIGLSVGETCCASQPVVQQQQEEEDGTLDMIVPTGSSTSNSQDDDDISNESGTNTSNEMQPTSSVATTTITTTATGASAAATTLTTTAGTSATVTSATTTTNTMSIHTSASYEPISTHPITTTTPAPKNPYYLGDDFVTIDELGIEISKGLSVRLIAQTGAKVLYANGNMSELSWHTKSDAAGIIPLNVDHPLEDGYVYISNSEADDSGSGGVYGLYFDKYGNITDCKALLTGTTTNCGGGITPWNTWVSCEEHDAGQCWEIDPIMERTAQTRLGSIDGGKYESVAVDNRNPDRPVFYVTEDREHGALRRYVANGNEWGALHSVDGGTTTFLHILGDGTFEWTTDEDIGQESAGDYFPNAEGIQVHEGHVYFMSKEHRMLIILDLDSMTYETEYSGMKFYGEGYFSDEPDQIIFGPTQKYMYFTEDGGNSPGVYARYGGDKTYFTLFQGINGVYSDDETVGIAISPDHKRFYAGIQDAGYIFEFSREDGLAFE